MIVSLQFLSFFLHLLLPGISRLLLYLPNLSMDLQFNADQMFLRNIPHCTFGHNGNREPCFFMKLDGRYFSIKRYSNLKKFYHSNVNQARLIMPNVPITLNTLKIICSYDVQNMAYEYPGIVTDSCVRTEFSAAGDAFNHVMILFEIGTQIDSSIGSCMIDLWRMGSVRRTGSHLFA